MKTNTTSPDLRGPSGRSFFRFPLSALAAVAAAMLGVSCSDFQEGPPAPAEAYVSQPSGSLAPGDEISIAFPGAPELNTKQKIQANGKISLPTIGDVSAAGKSVTSFQSYLNSRYQPHLQDPTVVVSLDVAAAGVYVSGEVLRPGKIALDRPMTVLEAVMEAGGFTKFANPKQVVVVRKEGGRNQRYVLNLNDAFNGVESRPFYLRPFDVIYVRQSAW